MKGGVARCPNNRADDRPHPCPRYAEITQMLRLLSLLLAHSACAIVVVTHASGRMGVSVVGQLREQLLLNPERERPPWCEASEDSLQIRAVVRSEQEAARLQLDLCGSCLLYTSPSPRDKRQSRMPSSA